MNTTMKKGTLAIALLSALTLSLAGCGTSNNAKPVKAKEVTTASVQKTSGYNQYIVIEPGSKAGPDGKMHDAFINGDIKITEGQPVALTVYGLGKKAHPIAIKDLGVTVNETARVADGKPSVTTVQFTPDKTGKFMWNCTLPCDGDNNDWAMANDNYMMGYVNVVK